MYPLILVQWTHPYQSVHGETLISGLEVDGLTGNLTNKELLKDRASVRRKSTLG